MALFHYRHTSSPAISPNAAALEIDHLSAGYPGAPRPILRDISLEVERGSRVALIGPNGAGKSTLLKAIVGLLPIRSGAIAIYGLPAGSCLDRIAYLPQRGEIDWRFPVTVRRLVLSGRYVHLGWFRRPTADDDQQVDQALERLGIADLGERQIGELSGGQQQRALLARTLVQDADLLLLDEPFNAVDAVTREIIVSVLESEQRRGKTSLVATHDLDRLADDFDRVIAMRDGRQVSDLPAGLVTPDFVLQGMAA